MKNKITIRKSNDQLHFYLHCEQGTAYLFTQKFSKAVYDYFRVGRSDNELHKFRYGGNFRLDHTVDKCISHSYRRWALEELAA